MSVAVAISQEAMASENLPAYLIDRTITSCIDLSTGKSASHLLAEQEAASMMATTRFVTTLVAGTLLVLVPAMLLGQVERDAGEVAEVIRIDQKVDDEADQPPQRIVAQPQNTNAVVNTPSTPYIMESRQIVITAPPTQMSSSSLIWKLLSGQGTISRRNCPYYRSYASLIQWTLSRT
jgi:hypothetical protein